ncbi:MAG: hypothetical protein ABUT39_19755 [Acidobacteriota bacterium]
MRRGALCLMLSLFCVAWIRPPGPSLIVETTSYADSLIRNPQFTVLAVKVLRAGIVQGTNAAPPEGEFQVVEVLRGGGSVGPGTYRYKVALHRQATEDAAVWDSRPVHGPVPGDELIVFTYAGSQPVANGGILWLQGPMIRDTPSLRTRVVENLEHDSELQFPLFLLILAAPALGFVRRIGWLSLPVAFGAYAVYENLMSSAYDIRVDLLLIWPALIASAVVPLAAHAWRRRQAPAA